MIVAGIAELKAKLSEHLSHVRTGDEVLITDHGRPVARIVPAVGQVEELASLEREGVVRVGSMRLPSEFFEARRPAPEGARVTESLLEERRQGR